MAPRNKKARRSDEEVLRTRLDALPEEGRDWLQAPLTGVTHSKAVSPPTQRMRDRVRRLWALFVTQSGDPAVKTVGEAFVLAPSEAVIKAFVRFLATALQGVLEIPEDPDAPPPATVATVEAYVSTLYALVAGEGHVVDKGTRVQVRNFLSSDDLRTHLPLSTMQREKHYASVGDVRKLVDSYYADTQHFSTNRMRVQMCALTLLLLLSTERIGAVVESNCYRGSNVAIAWKDVLVVVTPNPKTPSRPDVELQVTFRLLKGARSVQSCFKLQSLFPEHGRDRPYCPILPFLVLGLQDQVWESIDRPEDILSPRVPPTGRHALRARQEKRDLLVFRAETKPKDGVPSVSPTRAMTYSTATGFLRVFSRLNGFSADVRPHDIRRGTCNAVANDPSIGAEQRERLMAHSVGSKTYQRSYESTRVRADIQGSLCGGQREERLASIARAECMSSGADPGAPTRASAEALIDSYYGDSDVIALYRERNELIADVPGSDGREKAKVLGKELSAIIARERRRLVEEQRQAHFAASSTRQLEGVPPPAPCPMASMTAGGRALLSRHERPDVAGILNGVKVGASSARAASFSDCVDALVAHLYGEPLIETDRHDALLTACRLLLAMPVACHALCYPGESPTPENRCPVCDVVCSSKGMNRGVAHHIHGCLFKAKQSEADMELDAQYTPTRCRWRACRSSHTTWPSRREFVAHIRTHTRAARACRWADPDGITACGEDDVGDWPTHLARHHATDVRHRATVVYCYACSEWFRDVDDVDGLVWEAHCREHYDALFAPFSRRGDEAGDGPTGVYVYPEAYNRIGYDLGSGFGGKRPEYHGHLEQGIVLAPMFCIWCVHDAELPIVRRMAQYSDYSVFRGHLGTHTKRIAQDSVCPSPSCGNKTYDKEALLLHIVNFHLLGIFGVDRGGPDRRLKLPVPGSKRPLPDQDSSQVRKRPRKQPDFKCKGCSRPVQRIDEHIAKHDRCKKAARYVRMVDGKVVGDDIHWVPHS